jgi:hypothetical protein
MQSVLRTPAGGNAVKTFSATLFSTVILSLGVGCNNDRDRPAASPANTTETTATRVDDEADEVTEGTGPVSGASASAAREQITDARCAREQRCENIGDNKKYSSLDDCRATVRAEWKDDLNGVECPNGIDQSELDECIGEIRGEDCGDPIDALSRVAACTTGQICIG